MRSITIQLPRGNEQPILRLAREHGGSGERVSHGRGADGEDLAVMEIQFPNDRLDGFVSASMDVTGIRFTFVPTGVLTIEPPLSEIRNRVRDVSPRGTLELVLGALQVNAEFTRPESSGAEGEALLIQAWITTAPGASEAQLETAGNALRDRIAEKVGLELPGVVPFVDLSTLPPPR
jgi:hypothetical protein